MKKGKYSLSKRGIMSLVLVFALVVVIPTIYVVLKKPSAPEFSGKVIGNAQIKPNVTIIPISNSADVRKELQEASSDDGQVTLMFKGKLPSELENLKPGSIFILPSASDAKGFQRNVSAGSVEEALLKDLLDRTIIGRLTTISNEDGGSKISFVVPCINEVFSKVDADVNQPIVSNNSSMGFLDGVDVYAATKGTQDDDPATASANVDSDVKDDDTYIVNKVKFDILDQDIKDEKERNKDDNISSLIVSSKYAIKEDGLLLKEESLEAKNFKLIKFKKTGKNSDKTKNPFENAVKANAKISFTDTALVGKLIYEADANNLPKKFDCTMRLNGDISAHADLSFEFESKNELKPNHVHSDDDSLVKIEGISNADNEIPIGYALVDVGILRAGIGGESERIPLPVAYGVLFTITLDGKVSAKLDLNYDFSAYMDKGFSIKYNNNKFEDNVYDTMASTSYPNPNKPDENRPATKIEKASKPENKISLEGSVSGNLNTTLGFNPVLYLANVNVARLSHNTGFKGDFNLSGKLEYPGGIIGKASVKASVKAKAYTAAKFAVGLKGSVALTDDWKISIGGILEKELFETDLAKLEYEFPLKQAPLTLAPEMKTYIPNGVKDYQFMYLNLKGNAEDEAVLVYNLKGPDIGASTSSKVLAFEKQAGKWVLFSTPDMVGGNENLMEPAFVNMILVGKLKVNNHDCPVFLLHGDGYSYNAQAVALFVYNNSKVGFDYYGGIYASKLDVYKKNMFPYVVLKKNKLMYIDEKTNEIVINDGYQNISRLAWTGNDLGVVDVSKKPNMPGADIVIDENSGISTDDYYADKITTTPISVGDVVYLKDVGNFLYDDKGANLYKWIDKVHFAALKKGIFEFWLKDCDRYVIFEIK